MAVVETTIIPLGTGTPSISKHLARALRALREEKQLKYEITAMGTIIEGDLGEVLGMVRKMHEAAFGEGVMRVVTTIKIDERQDRPLSMSGKVESLKRELERS